jgi:hypothetical protein
MGWKLQDTDTLSGSTTIITFIFSFTPIAGCLLELLSMEQKYSHSMTSLTLIVVDFHLISSTWRQKCKKKDNLVVAPSLETTEQEFRELCMSEPHLLDSNGVIVLRKSLADPVQGADLIGTTLLVAYPDAKAEVQSYTADGGTIEQSMFDVIQHLRERRAEPTHKSLQRTPRNILSILSDVVTNVPSPAFLSRKDCLLLPLVCQKGRAEVRARQDLATARKKTNEPGWLQ